jgi:ABC-type xylose transport system permease subunit
MQGGIRGCVQAIWKGGAMTDTNNDGNPNLGKNRFIFASAGAVLTGLVGAAVAGGAGALVGALLGGLVGYNILKRL